MSVSVEDAELLDYIFFRHSTYLHYRDVDIPPEDYQALIPRVLKFVNEDVPTSVLIASDDPTSLLELGIRYFS
jgi:hypothetical protein